MAGIFPRNGLAPDVDNSGVDLTNTPATGCAALYYNERCTQKIDPVALNKLISEIVTVINACTTLTYDCSRTDNLLRAIQCLIPSAVNPEDDPCTASYAAGVAVFDFTGADQTWTVPSGVKWIKVKLWGGAGSGIPGGGPGGYTWAVLPVTPGEALTIVAGSGGKLGFNSVHTAVEYGLGGLGYATGSGSLDESSSGGGLSGIFRGSFSQANALAIAGGGAGRSDDEMASGVIMYAEPGNGSGGQSGMQGQSGDGTTAATEGGGGGGYNGGSKTSTATGTARGGSGYLHASAACGEILRATSGSSAPPGTSESDHGGTAGVVALINGGSNNSAVGVRANHGRVVIRF